MNKKKNNKTKKIVFWTLFAVILLVAIYYVGTLPQSILVIRNKPLDIGTVNFAGAQGAFETIKLGCSDSSYDIKGKNDASVTGMTFCNSLTPTSNLLILHSNINYVPPTYSSGITEYIRTNYIQTTELLPIGKYDVSYNYNINDLSSQQDSQKVSFTVGSYSETSDNAFSTLTYSKSNTYEFILTEPKEVIFRIDTTAGGYYGGDASGDMQIAYSALPANYTNSTICPIGLPAPPCSTATIISDTNGCFIKWDVSTCTITPIASPFSLFLKAIGAMFKRWFVFLFGWI